MICIFTKKTLSKKNENKIFSYNIPTGKLQTEIANQDDTIPFEIIRTPIILGGYGNTPVSTCCLILYLKNDNVVFDYSKEPCLWTFGDQVYLKENFNDTIYCVSDQSLEPRYVFDLGDRHWPYEERFHPEGNEDKIGFNYVLEGEKVLFLFSKPTIMRSIIKDWARTKRIGAFMIRGMDASRLWRKER